METESASGQASFTCRFLVMAAGYIMIMKRLPAALAGRGAFSGRSSTRILARGLDYAGKNIAVIGSGATAVTLVPELAKQAAHVTMVQRSPSYIVSRPAVDLIAEWLKGWLPATAAYAITRWKNVALTWLFYRLARGRPERMARKLIDLARRDVGERFEAADFTPPYKPWDQRLCLVPDGDLFAAISDGRASIATEPSSGSRNGIRLVNGEDIAADIIVAATD